MTLAWACHSRPRKGQWPWGYGKGAAAGRVERAKDRQGPVEGGKFKFHSKKRLGFSGRCPAPRDSAQLALRKLPQPVRIPDHSQVFSLNSLPCRAPRVNTIIPQPHCRWIRMARTSPERQAPSESCLLPQSFHCGVGGDGRWTGAEE
jgi:hypothetical protein